ncbi:MAG: hypothetical protein ACI8W3_000344 [Myxococcota bacterium]
MTIAERLPIARPRVVDNFESRRDTADLLCNLIFRHRSRNCTLEMDRQLGLNFEFVRGLDFDRPAVFDNRVAI